MKRSLLALTMMLLLVGIASATTVTGIVTDSTDAAVEGASVIIRTTVATDECPRGTVFRTVTDATGEFMLEGVPEGTWTIRASKRMVGYTQQDIDVPAEGIINVELALPGCDGEGGGGGGNGDPRQRRQRIRNFEGGL